ncbi:MAG TPA: hypothetical protein VEW65_08315 [Chryseolinea sp.]|nr:hypothetical protein [Chryseolinea sp.]
MKDINGFYDDYGNKINTDLIKKPGLCLLCKRDEIDDPMEHILCAMNRHDQRHEEEFKCGVFEKK